VVKTTGNGLRSIRPFRDSEIYIVSFFIRGPLRRIPNHAAEDVIRSGLPMAGDLLPHQTRGKPEPIRWRIDVRAAGSAQTGRSETRMGAGAGLFLRTAGLYFVRRRMARTASSGCLWPEGPEDTWCRRSSSWLGFSVTDRGVYYDAPTKAPGRLRWKLMPPKSRHRVVCSKWRIFRHVEAAFWHVWPLRRPEGGDTTDAGWRTGAPI